MTGKTKNLRKILLLIAAANLCLFGAATVCAQDEAERRLWDGAFIKKRAEAKTPSADSSSRKSAYKRVTPKKTATPNPPTPASINSEAANKPSEAANKPEEKSDDEMIGLTIWRLRPARDGDSKESRLLIEDESKKESEWTAERVEAGTVFAASDKARLSIESPRDGYLYIIDREQYADGTVSDPYLIFPTLYNRGNANRVGAGRLIELPAGRKAFDLTPMRPDYAGEALTILVTPEPLAELKPDSGRPKKLDPEMVKRWESQWGGLVERFELVDGAGRPYTKAEKEAGQEGARSLTQDDAMPQSLYHVNVKSGAPLLVKVPLRIGK
jgi:hypothetical protein